METNFLQKVILAKEGDMDAIPIPDEKEQKKLYYTLNKTLWKSSCHSCTALRS
ncbi:hypothetical protein [Evansella tamaricis]|uniref:Uncharacterized protein n=1 Tax=Evansella tamaricis TaxID=2069301 RepID=A0ABS6JHG3_9BACI|nr:hypothetical protein [Evansella tamaricis]MBU9712297.1 hypothetical protein [Evansella tamaricis]